MVTIFVPPNPEDRSSAFSKLVFWILLVARILGAIASVFLPAYTGVLGVIAGICVIVGGAGLLAQHKEVLTNSNRLFR